MWWLSNHHHNNYYCKQIFSPFVHKNRKIHKICTAHKSFIASKRNAVMKGWSIIILLIANISEQSLSHYNMSLLHIQSRIETAPGLVWMYSTYSVQGRRIALLTTFCLLHTIESLEPHFYWNNVNIPSLHININKMCIEVIGSICGCTVCTCENLQIIV